MPTVIRPAALVIGVMIMTLSEIRESFFLTSPEKTSSRWVSCSTPGLVASDIYLVAEGVDINDVPPRFFTVAFLGDTGYINVVENNYEVYVTGPASKDVLAGPFPFTATNGDVVQFAITDQVDPNLLDIINYDHLSVAP